MLISKIKEYEDEINLNSTDLTSYEGIIALSKCGKANLDIAKKVETLFPIIEEVYPDMWDYGWYNERNHDNVHATLYIKKSSYIPCINIHFPIVNITNSLGIKHTIYNLYVKLGFSDDMIYIYGIRGTYDHIEFHNEYSHSHLPNDIGTFKKFCLGTSDILTLTIIDWDNSNYINLFKLLLYQIKTFIEWESLEGGPYKYIETIILKRPLKPIYVYESLLDIIIKNIDITKLNISFYPLQIAYDESFINEVTLSILLHKNSHNNPTEINKFLALKVDNEFYTYTDNDSCHYEKMILYDKSFIFKHQVLNVIVDNYNTYSTGKIVAHPEVIKIIYERFNKKIIKFAISESVNRKFNSN